MRHVPEGTLRRMVDEPRAVPDASVGHLRGCVRCQIRRDRVAQDAAAARALLSRPQLAPDLDRAWDRVVRGPGHVGAGRRGRRAPHMRRRRWRAMGATVSGGTAAMLASVVVVGAAAATLTTVFAPTHVVPVPVHGSDLRAFTRALDLDGALGRAGSPASTPSTPGAPGARSWAFGTIQASAPTKAVQTWSLATAEATAGLAVTLPSTLPNGVAGPPRFTVRGASTLTVAFDARAGTALDGSTLTLTVEPAVLARYGGTGGTGTGGTGTGGTGTGGTGTLPTLAVLTMPRPTATATGASVGELESFLLSQPGVPKDLAQELRLLGNLQNALPIPIPPGASETSTTIAGAPAVALTEAGGVASGVVWEDHHGMVRTVAGLVDEEDALHVAQQLG